MNQLGFRFDETLGPFSLFSTCFLENLSGTGRSSANSPAGGRKKPPEETCWCRTFSVHPYENLTHKMDRDHKGIHRGNLLHGERGYDTLENSPYHAHQLRHTFLIELELPVIRLVFAFLWLGELFSFVGLFLSGFSTDTTVTHLH